jgi:cytochrome c oxidase subunit 2
MSDPRSIPDRVGRGARTAVLLLTLAAVGGVGGCNKDSNALLPAGLEADRISTEWWFFFTVACFVYILVMAVLIVALARRRKNNDQQPDIHADGPRERRVGRTIVGAVTITAVILIAFLLSDFLTGRVLSAKPHNPMRIRVSGHQWWWEVRYTSFPWEPGGGTPSGMVTGANEIHVPVGRPVLIDLDSSDVIHSFWIPQLNGKKDLVPGQPTTTWIQADRPGTYFGQCAEYCGFQHANMHIWVVAQPEDEFRQWLDRQRKSADDPVAQRLQHGRAVFLGNSCVLCHTVQGTPANGAVGPNLTHVAGRQRIAAGTLVNNRGNLAGWITDPQRIKPGVQMPRNNLSPDDLNALLDWIETLK